MHMMRRFALVVVLFLILGSASAQLTDAPAEFQGGVKIVACSDTSVIGMLINGPSMFNNPVTKTNKSYSVTADVVFALPLTGCGPWINEAAFKGKIVLFSFGAFCSPQTKLVKFAALGAVGGLHTQVSEAPASWNVFDADTEHEAAVTIPCNMVAKGQGLDLGARILLGNRTNITAITGKPGLGHFITMSMIYQEDVLYSTAQGAGFSLPHLSLSCSSKNNVV